jgi:hypothetical protein
MDLHHPKNNDPSRLDDYTQDPPPGNGFPLDPLGRKADMTMTMKMVVVKGMLMETTTRMMTRDQRFVLKVPWITSRSQEPMNRSVQAQILCLVPTFLLSDKLIKQVELKPTDIEYRRVTKANDVKTGYSCQAQRITKRKRCKEAEAMTSSILRLRKYMSSSSVVPHLKREEKKH